MNSVQVKMFAVGATVLAVVIALFTLIGIERIEGNERAVVQNWDTGVLDILWTPGTNFYIPLTTRPYVYNIGSEKFIMGKAELYNGEGKDYTDYPAFTVTTGGSGREQPATFSVTLNYRLDPTKLVTLHNYAQTNYEDLVIKPNLTRIISDTSTQLTVLDFYSGTGRVELQKAIEVAITTHPALSKVGIIVDTFVIDDISLDTNYVAEITGRQLATQKKLRAIEEAKAAQEVAKQVEAEAQAEKLKKIVAAEAKKQERIKAAEAQSAEVELAARANATKVKEKASADRFRKEEDAKGLLAQGTAQARVADLKKTSKYSGQAGARQAEVEIAQARVGLFQNMHIKGVISEKTALTIINGNIGVTPTMNVGH